MNRQSNIANQTSQIGFTLLELIITMTVLAILVLGTIPLTQNAVKSQKEMRLRQVLREMREAIDEFHRDTVGACAGGNQQGGANNAAMNNFNNNQVADPRSRVSIDDCKIFGVENLDRYPPSLNMLVEGVKVKPRGLNTQLNSGLGDDPKSNVFKKDGETDEKIKVYLRELPVDPMTGEKDWKFRSSYQTKDDESWDDVNVFDVHSASDAEALNGEKYSDW